MFAVTPRSQRRRAVDSNHNGASICLANSANGLIGLLSMIEAVPTGVEPASIDLKDRRLYRFAYGTKNQRTDQDLNPNQRLWRPWCCRYTICADQCLPTWQPGDLVETWGIEPQSCNRPFVGFGASDANPFPETGMMGFESTIACSTDECFQPG